MSQLPSQTGVAEFGATLETVRGAKLVWSILVIVAILVHLAGFGLAEFTEETPKPAKKATPPPAPTQPATSTPATMPPATGNPKPETGPQDTATPSPSPAKGAEKGAAKTPEKKDAGFLKLVKVSISQAMPLARALAPVLCIILSVTLFLGTMVSLVGRTGGSTGFTSAFFWSLILLAVLVPWQSFFPNSPLSGAMFRGGISSIVDARARLYATGHMTDKIFYYGRYVSYPVIALLLWLLVQAKFGRAYKTTVNDSPPAVSISVEAARQRRP